MSACVSAVLQLLDVVHSLLTAGRTATQRDLYYTVSWILQQLHIATWRKGHAQHLCRLGIQHQAWHARLLEVTACQVLTIACLLAWLTLLLQLLGPPFFSHSKQLTSAIHTALALLRLPRAALGIAAASKGAVAGLLLLRARPGEAWQDCSLTGPSGRAIPGEVGAVQAMQMR